ncbi:MAG TPA: ATP-binding protein [Solirubrobacteraceae bacterium]|nr:ATP-binding protein [Solirubrobacteraceae bacterium]
MPEPIVPRGISTELNQVAPHAAGAKLAPSPLRLNLGATVWDASSPLTPVVLSETERRFKFRGLPQAVGAARRSLREWERYFEPDLFYDLSLCVSELVTKSVQHAATPRAEEIELAVSRRDELVRAEVLEHRKGVVVTQPPVMDSKDWGMFIVDRVADRWGVDRRLGTLLWCEIDLATDGRSRDWLVSGRRPSSSI